MATKIEKLHLNINDQFKERLHEAFENKFPGRKIETNYNIFSMNLVSAPSDGSKFTRKEHAWLTGFSEGYSVCMNLVCEPDHKKG